MSDQIENYNIKANLFDQTVDLNNTLLAGATSNYAYNKINNLLLMQILAKVEGRDLEEIRTNVERYIKEFSEEFIRMNARP